jgi:hypothetical protein
MNTQEMALRAAQSAYEDSQAHMRRARLKHEAALEALQKATEGLIQAGTFLATTEYRLKTLEKYIGRSTESSGATGEHQRGSDAEAAD